ncbi:hypothetical protein [Sporosarcina sp. ITBMC105]
MYSDFKQRKGILLAKKKRIEVAQCINGEYVFPSDAKRIYGGMSAMATALIVPSTASAQSSDTFARVYHTVLDVADRGVVFVIIFAGAAWALGNRPKALEVMLGSAIGYIVIRNAILLRDFLKSLTPDTGGL